MKSDEIDFYMTHKLAQKPLAQLELTWRVPKNVALLT